MHNLQTFIEKAKQIHGDKYNYSSAKYVNSKTKLEIVCPIHGPFYQTPETHANGSGCKKCYFKKASNQYRKDTAYFIKKSHLIHGNRYDYSKTQYTTNHTKVKIICPIHGEFEQLPTNHYRYGCNKCGSNIVAKKMAKNQNDFIREAKTKHGDKYDYSNVKYKNTQQKIAIICNRHGVFFQTPDSHLHGRGCPSCKKGIGHPRYGKPAHSPGYFGIYKHNTFRSLQELFWMLAAEQNNIDFIGLDQFPNRSQWQVQVTYDGNPHTYCADFYVPSTNEVIDIKPAWKMKLQTNKLEQGKIEYEKRGYIFRLFDTKNIKVNERQFKKMVLNGEINLHPSAEKKFKARFGV